MENYCNEIGQKMRSAVKAKLLELGTGGSSGYIDDELPDYVMIMVANKRSKQQMIADLNLFLGTQTELFVTWLHEVLQKLQQVTLPASSVTKKRKNVLNDEATTTTTSSSSSASKKSKKLTKKEKTLITKPKEQTSTTPTIEKSCTRKPQTTQLADVFAEDFLEKAKESIEVHADVNVQIKKLKSKTNVEETTHPAVIVEPRKISNSNNSNNATNEFDIPTISEISSTTGANANCIVESNKRKLPVISGNRAKDLEELAEIQKKIYAAKRQLKQLGEIEDDDKDFINLRDDDSREGFNEVGELVRKPKSPPSVQVVAKKRSPITFETRSIETEGAENKNKNDINTSIPKRRQFTPPCTPALPVENSNYTHNEKRPVHERLGTKNSTIHGRDNQKISQNTSRERRKTLQDKELYIPTFRRKETERERERDRDKERSGDNERVRERGRERERRMNRSRDRDRNNSRVYSRQSRSPEKQMKVRSISEMRNSEDRNSSQVGKITTTTPSRDKGARSNSSDDVDLTILSDIGITNTHSQRKRIGSRVILAPTKVTEASDEDDLRDKPVNSIIKIKPRPTMSPSKQAPKNLLLKAVAEAQRSTILNKPTTNIPNVTVAPSKKLKLSMRLGERVQTERNTKLYTKSYRDRLKNATSSGGVGAIFRRTAENLIVEVNGGLKNNCKNRVEAEDEEYVPELVSDRGESDHDYVYVPQHIAYSEGRGMNDAYEITEYEEHRAEKDVEEHSSIDKTQFVVTLNEDKALPTLKCQEISPRYSRSLSPPPQVTSSSRDREPSSTSNSVNSHKVSNKERLTLKSSLTFSSVGNHDTESHHESCKTPPLRRTELIEMYGRHKEVKKVIIKSDSDDDEIEGVLTDKSRKQVARTFNDVIDRHRKSVSVDSDENDINRNEEDELEHRNKGDDFARSTTPPMENRQRQKESAPSSTTSGTTSVHKRKHTPIKYDLEEDKERRVQSHSPVEAKRRRSNSRSIERDKSIEYRRDTTQSRSKDDRDSSHERKEEKRKISIRNAEPKKYDNLPSSLNSVPVDSANYRILKPKERCKYHPNCTKTFCEYYHPSAPCKSFPNCKFGDKCMYSHPKCKYDLACVNLDCQFSHSGPRSTSLLESVAPPLSSSVVPVQNYKTITANTVVGPVSSTTCKYFPNCTKATCPFYHPKPCRWGKNCISKLECMFYHHELASSSKFKWVASIN